MAVTLNVAAVPAKLVRLCGWLVICGAIAALVTVSTATALVMLP